MLVTALTPLFIAFQTTEVSSMCDALYQQLNGLRLQDNDAADLVHAKTFPLLFTLERINNQQGLGFTVFGWVIDRKTLNVIAASVLSVAGGVLPLLMAMLPDAESPGSNTPVNATTAPGTAGCALGATHLAIIESLVPALNALNQSCVYTIAASIGGGVCISPQ